MINATLCSVSPQLSSLEWPGLRLQFDHSERVLHIHQATEFADPELGWETRVRALSIAMMWTGKYYDVRFCYDTSDLSQTDARR